MCCGKAYDRHATTTLDLLCAQALLEESWAAFHVPCLPWPIISESKCCLGVQHAATYSNPSLWATKR